MEIAKKIVIIILPILFLSGCIQSTTMVGPTMTLVSSGNVYQAGASYGANKAIENETGMPPSKYIFNKIEDNKINKKKETIDNDLYESISILLELNIEKTKKLIN